ncbi:penicillin-binding protein activator [Granulosicoccaceae sp. 1_MG-2023]|nr:penicillin-binding protein activator [Granulosicoccaceae sp. 1_MG-2023]
MSTRFIPKAALLGALIVSLSACQTMPGSGSYSGATNVESARTAAKGGNYQRASETYAKLAERSDDPTEKAHLQLLAAETLIDNGLYAEGGQLRLQAISPPLPAPDLQNRYNILLAKADLINGEAQSALTRLPDPAGIFDATTRARIYEVRAGAYARLEQPDEELAARVNLDSLLTQKGARATNHQIIWELLDEQPTETLQSMTLKVHGDAYQGWLELALLLRDNNSSHQLDRRLALWSSRFPNHPASQGYSESVIAEARSSLPQAPVQHSIAAFLPLSGRTAAAGRALRDGMITAYLSAPENASGQLHFYDTGSADFVSLYRRAVESGATLAVGPLSKNNVNMLAMQASLPVPTLALNYSTDNATLPAELYQFGLLPEDEAASAAQRALAEGLTRAVVLTADDALSQRLAAAFERTLTEGGGQVVGSALLPPDSYDYSQALQEVLKINESKARRRTLQSTLGRQLRFEPVVRQDANMIYITADARQARMIRPQLQFFRAGDLPIMASSRANNASDGTRQDSDLNNILFTDTPWAVESTNAGSPERETINTHWGDNRAYARLYAMGVDAFNMLGQLEKMHDDPQYRFAGNTGELSMSAQNRIHRHLHWAKYVDGKAVIVDNPFAAPEEN